MLPVVKNKISIFYKIRQRFISIKLIDGLNFGDKTEIKLTKKKYKNKREIAHIILLPDFNIQLDRINQRCLNS
jgi:hypothetical protein